MQAALGLTCDGVDSCHHQQHGRGKVQVPAQGYLDEEGSREDVSLQRARTQEPRSPKALTVATRYVSSCSAIPSAVNPHPIRRLSLKRHNEEDGLDLEDAEDRRDFQAKEHRINL